MKNDFKGYAIYSQFGFVIITSVIIGILIGKKLDEILNTTPIFLLIFIILSLVSSFINFFFKIMKDFDKNSIHKNKYIYAINFIVESILLTFVCFIIGNIIDKYYKLNNIFTILFVIISISFNLFIFLKKFNIKFKLNFRRKKE